MCSTTTDRRSSVSTFSRQYAEIELFAGMVEQGSGAVIRVTHRY
jgi:hypothetical protein